jgi:tetratricopeptide (TPR) repeat protein
VLGLLAQTQSNQGMWEAAIATAGRALALAPRLAELYRLRGYALFEAARFPEAIQDLTRAIEIAPDARTYWLRSSVRIRVGDMAGAEADRKAQRSIAGAAR